MKRQSTKDQKRKRKKKREKIVEIMMQNKKENKKKTNYNGVSRHREIDLSSAIKTQIQKPIKLTLPYGYEIL